MCPRVQWRQPDSYCERITFGPGIYQFLLNLIGKEEKIVESSNILLSKIQRNPNKYYIWHSESRHSCAAAPQALNSTA